MSNYNYHYLYFFILIFAQALNAQYIADQSEFNFNSITTADGLSQNTVNTILEDKSGFIWFGTDDGLNRYNSYDINIINTSGKTSNILSGNKILSLYEDAQNIIWIGTDNGLKSFNSITEKLTAHNLFQNFSAPIRVNSIAFESDSNIWLGTSEGLILYNKNEGITQHYRYNSSKTNTISDSDVLSLVTFNGNLWIGTKNGLNFFNSQTKKFTNYFHKKNSINCVAGNTIKALSVDNNGNLWIGTLQGGVSFLNVNSNKFISYNTQNSPLRHNEIFDISLSSNNEIWIATNGGGLTKINPESKTFTNYLYNSNHLHSIASNAVYSILEDTNGILWVGTYAEGVSYNTSKRSLFKIVKHQTHDANSIIENRVRSIYLDKSQQLWFGTLGGISVYNPQKKLYTSYYHNAKKPNSLSFNTVTSILQDYKGRMWFGTYSGGLNRLSKNNSNFIHYTYSTSRQNSISDDKIYCLIEDNANNLWIGTQRGLNLYNEEEDNFTTYGNIEVRDIKLDHKGNLVIATMGGIVIFNPKTEIFEDYYTDELISTPISETYIDNTENLIWFCSQGKGMGYLDLKTKTFSFFTKKDGLSSNFVASFQPYEDVLWVSTFNGLNKFNTNTKSFDNFTHENKLSSKHFHPRASAVLPDGTFGFGASDGLIVFNPKHLDTPKNYAPIIFSSLKINNKIVDISSKNSPLKKSINKTKLLNLKSHEKDFTIEFAALDFFNNGNNKYAYTLEGYMDKWVDIGNSRSVSFTNLNHGNYVFKVKNTNNSSINEVKSLKISIAPPFYSTWWFKLLILILIAIILYYYNKYTIISTKQKNENELQRIKLKNEEDFNQMRFRFFTYVSHELRTPLTLISDPVMQLMKNYNDKNHYDYKLLSLINKNSNRLLRLVDQILDISKIEGDTLSLQVAKQNIVKCIDDTTAAFHEFALKNNIKFKFFKENDVMKGWVDEDKLEKIIYNLLSNAFKFTLQEGTISISLHYFDEAKDKVIISIEDSGIGIPEDKLSKIFEGFYQVRSAKSLNPNGAGIGLDYVNRLTKLHKGTITVESEINKGSKFTITIPIKKRAYDAKNIRNYVAKRPTLKPIVLNKNENNEIPKNLKKHHKNTPTILVVEDDFDIRSYIVESLSHKFQVVDAPNGKEGLVKAKEVIPNLILSDTLMPVMDGLEFCKEVKKDDTINHIPFMFLSAWSSDEFKLNGLSIGAIDYIKKPFNYEILESRISNIIETNKKISENSKTKVNFIPENKSLDSIDDSFVRKAYDVLDKNFSNPEFTAAAFKDEMNMSHSGLYRKLTQLTGKSSNEFIRDYRLKRATQIIKQNSGLLISEICIMTGFNDPKYFSKCFKQAYKISPTEFAKKYKNSSNTEVDEDDKNI